MSDIRRMWVNQPSKLQRYHHLHGQRVHADIGISSNQHKQARSMVRVYFLHGSRISQNIHRTALSEVF